MIFITQNSLDYEIKFEYNQTLISMIKNVPGRQWHPKEKIWTIPVDKLGWFLNQVKGTPYEEQIRINSNEHINQNETLDATDNTCIPDVDISDVDLYVQDGSSLYSHQLDFLKYAKSRLGRGFLLADEMGCVSGDTIININIGRGSRKISLDKFFKRFHNLYGRSDKGITYYVRCLHEDTGIFGFNQVKDVLYSGEKEVYKLDTSRGKSVKATIDHEILTPNGYIPLQNLSIGDVVIVNSIKKCKKCRYATITNIEKIGVEPTYDIVMADPYRNFVANGVVVHNCGKTLEVMNYALYQRKVSGYKHCLILCCVNSAKFSWQEDIMKHTNGVEHAYILGTRKKRDGTFRYNTSGAEKLEDLQTGHMYGDKSAPELPYFIILNIEALRMKEGKQYSITEKIISMIIRRELQMVAIDEVHKNISPKSSQGKLILQIKKKTGRGAEWVPMTGTPIVNKPTDLFTPLKLIDAHNVKDFWSWCQRFVIYGGYGDHEILGYKNIPLLKNLLQKNMLRRLKSDVLDLPDKIYYTEYVENTPRQNKLYLDVQQGLYARKDQILQSMNPLAEMLKLRQVNGSPELIDDTIKVDDKYLSVNAKLVRLLELIDEIIERNEKVVVFSNWVTPLKTLYRFISKRYKTACFTGTMSEADRQKHKKVFINNPNYKVMLGTIGALGTNHTLTVANNVIFYDEPWTPADKVQAEDRCHRISASSPVNIYTLLSKGTIDESVHKIVYDKQDISNFIVDGKLDLRNNPELFDKLLGHDKQLDKINK